MKKLSQKDNIPHDNDAMNSGIVVSNGVSQNTDRRKAGLSDDQQCSDSDNDDDDADDDNSITP